MSSQQVLQMDQHPDDENTSRQQALQDVIEAIATLDDATCTQNPTILQTNLEPLLEHLQLLCDYLNKRESSPPLSPPSISPLLVACDKGHLVCLQYLALSQYGSDVIGSPLQRSFAPAGANTPIHHAAMSGCAGAWNILGDLLLLEEDVDADNNEKTPAVPYLRLASLTNAHGDTPLQMAVSSGHLSFVQTWYDLCCGAPSSPQQQADIQKILQMSNHAGDTCASLACCHGFEEILVYLLETCHTAVKHDEVQTCQQAVYRMDLAIHNLVESKTTTEDALLECQERQARVHACLAKLQAALEQQAEDAANELLLGDNDLVTAQASTSKSSKKNKKNKKKKKGKGNNSATKNVSNAKETATTNKNSAEAGQQQEGKTGNDEFFVVKRLQDGRVAVAVTGEDNASKPPPPQTNNNTIAATIMPAKPVDTLFRERFRGHQQASTATATATAATTAAASRSTSSDNAVSAEKSGNMDIDAVMDALCLDVSMLLYTPHSMALNLSPSQLDAIEQILQQQILSLREARSLQHKRQQATSPTSADADSDDNNDSGCQQS